MNPDSLLPLFQTALDVFTLIGFVVFLIGLSTAYLLSAAILLSMASQLFVYPYQRKHPRIYRGLIFRTETGEERLFTKTWVCNFKPQHRKSRWGWMYVS